MKFTQIAAASLLASVAIADPAAKRGLNVFDDISKGVNEIIASGEKLGGKVIDDMGKGLNDIIASGEKFGGEVIDGINKGLNGVENLVGESVCDIVKALGIEIPGLTEEVPDKSLFFGLIKLKDRMATTGKISLKDCSIKDGKAILGMTATAKLDGGELLALKKHKYDLPHAKASYSISIAADVCRTLGIPTGIKNFRVDSIKVGDATFDEHKIPKQILQFANKSLEKYAKKTINDVAKHAILKENQYGVCAKS